MSLAGESVIVHPVGPLSGDLRVPGDKSISHRVAMLAGICSGVSTVRGFLESEDCVSTLHAMEALGARTHLTGAGELKIEGTGGKLIEPAGPLDMGNSGTGIRLMTGLLAGHNLYVELTGDESLRSRPMKRIQTPLTKMGAEIELLGEAGCAPIRVHGGKLRGIEYELPVASAQVKSSILLAGLCAEGKTVVIEPAPSRDHTERAFLSLGIPIRIDGLRIELDGYGPKGPRLKARGWDIPGDFSSAAFFMVGAAAREGSELLLRNVGLSPRRNALIDVLKRMGACIEVELLETGEDEVRGDVRIRGARLKGTEVGGGEIPALIDELPLVAVAGALAEGETSIRDAGELRVKESDRIAVMAEDLQKLGVKVKEHKDGMTVKGPARIAEGINVNSYGDHRIVMALAMLASCAKHPVCINNTSCVNTSYPGFWDDLRSIGGHVEY